MDIKNAIIEKAEIEFEYDDKFLTLTLGCSYGDDGYQTFGGFVFCHNDDKVAESPFGVEYIKRVLQIAGVGNFNKLIGKTVRVKLEDEVNPSIIGIGHIVKDDWFYPKELSKKLKEQTNEQS